jgi:hypothetical protein
VPGAGDLPPHGICDRRAIARRDTGDLAATDAILTDPVAQTVLADIEIDRDAGDRSTRRAPARARIFGGYGFRRDRSFAVRPTLKAVEVTETGAVPNPQGAVHQMPRRPDVVAMTATAAHV